MGPFKAIRLLGYINDLKSIFKEIENQQVDQGVALGRIRHTLTALGGLLVSTGYMSDNLLQIVLGLLPTVLGFAWSILIKEKPTNG